MDISRRDALNRLALLVGGAISAPTMSAIFSGLRAEPLPHGWIPQTLTADQAELLGMLVEAIIPTTDTPGAREAGVVGFIDRILDDWAEPDEREQFLTGLATIDEAAQKSYGVDFPDATPTQQNALLGRLDREAVQARRERARPLPFFAILKEWTLVGYYTSEIGATQELQWLAVPGRFNGDLPLEEVGPTWA